MKTPRFLIILTDINGQVQGYLKSVSVYYNRVESTTNKLDAKTYAQSDTALRDAELASVLTHGGLMCNVVDYNAA